jgi:Skp family chaperone for outer membrane proteins
MDKSSRRLEFHRLGWVFAAAFAGAAFMSAFQAPTLKIGVVDTAKLVEDSTLGKQTRATFRQMQTAREELLEFIDTNRVLTTEQATRLRDLTVKPILTKEESAERDRIRADVIAANKKWSELATKNLTAEERTLMDEYARRSQAIAEFNERLLRTFTNEMQTFRDEQRMKGLEKARAAVREVSTAEGYTVVLEAGIAPFGANDLTDAALKAMDAKP